MGYVKEYLYGGATVRNTSFGDILEVYINVGDLAKKIKEGKVKLTDNGMVRFSVLKKKPENVKPGDSTHYLQHSRKEEGTSNSDPFGGMTTPQVEELDLPTDDLPF